jgi:hypothetical protein
LDQDGNVDKLKVRICVRGDLQKKKDPTMEDPHSSTASMRMYKLLLADAARHKSRIFQLGVIGAFLQEIIRSRVLGAIGVQITHMRTVNPFEEFRLQWCN